MAKIHYMKDKDGNTIYPVTHADAILGLEDVGSNVDLSDYQTKIDDNLVTQSKDLVGAINELFQSADSGKQLIANAIGEPVSAEDTFSAMSDDINGLLSTFKTNMMKNGITVEANDKFKSLIDKIATMVEDGEGKGIQFVSGEHVLTEVLYALVEPTITINANLNFDPYYVIVYIPNLTPLSSGYGNNPDVVVTTDCASVEIAAWYGTDYHYRGPKFTLNYTQDTINVKINKSIGGYNMQIPVGTVVKWYAIGVGEEDTTFRDSLADILENKGVDVTEEDDMASLITKVDNNMTQTVFPKWYKKGAYASFTGLPVGGWDIGSCVYNDDIYAFYGSNAYCLDMDTGIWKTITPMPTTRSGPSATCVGDKIYVIGGYSNTDNECYDPTTNTWTTKTSRDGTGTSRNVVYNNIIYFFGNKNAYTPPKCYDPATDTWTVKSGGPASRTTLDNTVGIINDMIYFIGQYTSDPFMYIYDPKTEVYTTGTITNSNYRYYAGSAVYNNIFYFFCGYGRYSCYAYDPINNTSWELDNYPSGQSLEHISSIVCKNYIINLGGEYYTDGKSYERAHCIAFIPE